MTSEAVNARGGQDDLDFYWGKGLVSRKLYNAAYKACGFPAPGDLGSRTEPDASCNDLLDQAIDGVGPHNTYFLYDNCDLSDMHTFLLHANKSYSWYTRAKRVELLTNGAQAPLTEAYEAFLASAASPADGLLPDDLPVCVARTACDKYKHVQPMGPGAKVTGFLANLLGEEDEEDVVLAGTGGASAPPPTKKEEEES